MQLNELSLFLQNFSFFPFSKFKHIEKSRELADPYGFGWWEYLRTDISLYECGLGILGFSSQNYKKGYGEFRIEIFYPPKLLYKHRTSCNLANRTTWPADNPMSGYEYACQTSPWLFYNHDVFIHISTAKKNFSNWFYKTL